jgi:hypothetical protein
VRNPHRLVRASIVIENLRTYLRHFYERDHQLCKKIFDFRSGWKLTK